MHKSSKKLGHSLSPSLFLVSKYICVKHGISQLVRISSQLTNQLIGKSQGSRWTTASNQLPINKNCFFTVSSIFNIVLRTIIASEILTSQDTCAVKSNGSGTNGSDESQSLLHQNQSYDRQDLHGARHPQLSRPRFLQSRELGVKLLFS